MKNSKSHLYQLVWQKYVPVIRILLKKSAVAEQAFTLNRTDFERAGIGRKAGYKFSISFIDSRPNLIFAGNEFVQSFILAVQDDQVIREHFQQNNYTFMFGSNYQLQIKNTSKEELSLLSQEVLTEQ